MKKRILLFPLLILASLLLTGCALQTVDEMYALPKRSKEYDSLQSAIDSAMYGLSYSAPVSGENQQTVQMADLDGDGVEEYIVFAQGNSANPLQVLIFRQEEDGTCRLMEVIQSNGSAFEQVEYVQMDNAPGYELVVGRQLSDQVLRSVSVYSFSSGSAEQLMMVGYSKFITCDLNDDGCSELMVILPGESETGTGSAVLYRMQDGNIERSVEVNVSEDATHIRRITVGRLLGGTPAVFVASAVNNSAIVTDVFAWRNDRFSNISYSRDLDTSVQTLRNYYVYAEDIDGDGASDLFETLSGTDRVLTDGTLTASAPVKVRCEFTPNTSGTYEITLRTSTPKLVTGMSCTDLADGGRMFLPDDVISDSGTVTAQMKIGSAFTTSYALEFECAAGARVDEILITRVG